MSRTPRRKPSRSQSSLSRRSSLSRQSSSGSVASGGRPLKRTRSGNSGVSLGNSSATVHTANSRLFPTAKRTRGAAGNARIATLNRTSSSGSSANSAGSVRFQFGSVQQGPAPFVFGQQQQPRQQPRQQPLSRREQFTRNMDFMSAASRLARASGARDADVLARQALEWARSQPVFPSANNAVGAVRRGTSTGSRWGHRATPAAAAAAAPRGRLLKNDVNEAAVTRAQRADQAKMRTTLRARIFDKQKWLGRKIKVAEFRGNAAQAEQLRKRYEDTLRVRGGNIAAAHRRTGQTPARAAETNKLLQAIDRAAAAAAGHGQVSGSQYALLGLRDPRQYPAENEVRGNTRRVTGNLRHLVGKNEYVDGEYVRLPTLARAQKKLAVYTDLLQYAKPENGRVNIARLAKNEDLRRMLRSRLIYRGQPIKLSDGSAVLPGANGKYRDPRVKNKPAFDMNLFRRAGVLRHIVNNLT